ncbi:hypothetical protein D3C76_1070110 [compost metagenome]
MGKGNFTSGGHYILLVGINTKKGVDWIDVYDPNHDNTKYGADGKINQGVKNDGKVSAQSSVFASQAKQYWIFDVPKQESDSMEKAKVYVNDAKMEDGFILDGRVYVPLRAVGEALGAKVGWDNKTKTARLTN